MNFLQRILNKQTGREENNHTFQKVPVCYEASISFNTTFLVHFYDAANMPFLLEKKGTYFQYQEYIPFQRTAAYFRIHVFNPLCMLGQTATISIKLKNEIAVEKTFAIADHNNLADWHSIKASLV